MSDGLGMRYAFLGILETTHLNAEGFINYCERYSKTIYEVSKTFKPVPKFEGPRVQDMAKQLESDVPLNKLPVNLFEFFLNYFVVYSTKFSCILLGQSKLCVSST